MENTKVNFTINNSIELNDKLEEKGKGHYFTSRFIEPGLATYQDLGTILITKETLNKFINTIVGSPVIIQHKDINDKNVDKERVGVVSDVWFNENDGWFYCSGVIWNTQAIDLIKNQGWNVSCSYSFESDNTKGIHNGTEYSMQFVNGEFLHLAIVNNPRYNHANIVVNSKDLEAVENTQWITVKPLGEDSPLYQHIPLDDGIDKSNKEDVKKGVKEFFDKKKDKEKNVEPINPPSPTPKYPNKENPQQPKKNDKKQDGGDFERILKETPVKPQKTVDERQERINKLIQTADDVSMFDSGSIEKREHERELKKLDELSIPDEEKQKAKEKLEKYHEEILTHLAKSPSEYKVGVAEFNKRVGYKKSNSQYEKAIDLKSERDAILKGLQEKIRKQENLKEFQNLSDASLEALKKGQLEFQYKGQTWFRKTTRRQGFTQLDQFTQKDYDTMKAKQNKANNSTERKDNIIMEILNDFKALVEGIVNNALNKEKEVENEKVDKRDIIRQIMAIAGKEEASEDVKTIAKLAEKLAYDDSEKDTADNKCKNEADEKEEKETVETEKEEVKDCKNEADKEEKEEKLEEQKEIAENKEKEEKEVKNSMDSVKDAIMGGNSEIKNVGLYTSQAERLELGNKF